MRDYARVAPQFWTGETGRQIRKIGSDAIVVAMYLVTCPSANMIGLYYLPLPTLCHETGLPLEGAIKALRSLHGVGFAFRDERSEIVFVPEGARFQIGAELKAGDNRIVGIARELEPYRKSQFFNRFLDRYAKTYHLNDVVAREPESPPGHSPSEAPSKPLGSQDQDQDQDQERDRAQARVALSQDADAEPVPPEPMVLVAGMQKRLALDLVGMWNLRAEPPLVMVTNATPSMPTLMAAVRHRPSMAEWTDIFSKAFESDYLMGRVAGKDGTFFRLDFWWLIDHADKILAGRYDNRAHAPVTPTQTPAADGQRPPTITESRAMLARIKAGSRP